MRSADVTEAWQERGTGLRYGLLPGEPARLHRGRERGPGGRGQPHRAREVRGVLDVRAPGRAQSLEAQRDPAARVTAFHSPEERGTPASPRGHTGARPFQRRCQAPRRRAPLKRSAPRWREPRHPGRRSWPRCRQCPRSATASGSRLEEERQRPCGAEERARQQFEPVYAFKRGRRAGFLIRRPTGARLRSWPLSTKEGKVSGKVDKNLVRRVL